MQAAQIRLVLLVGVIAASSAYPGKVFEDYRQPAQNYLQPKSGHLVSGGFKSENVNQLPQALPNQPGNIIEQSIVVKEQSIPSIHEPGLGEIKTIEKTEEKTLIQPAPILVSSHDEGHAMNGGFIKEGAQEVTIAVVPPTPEAGHEPAGIGMPVGAGNLEQLKEVTRIEEERKSFLNGIGMGLGFAMGYKSPENKFFQELLLRLGMPELGKILQEESIKKEYLAREQAAKGIPPKDSITILISPSARIPKYTAAKYGSSYPQKPLAPYDHKLGAYQAAVGHELLNQPLSPSIPIEESMSHPVVKLMDQDWEYPGGNGADYKKPISRDYVNGYGLDGQPLPRVPLYQDPQYNNGLNQQYPRV